MWRSYYEYYGNNNFHNIPIYFRINIGKCDLIYVRCGIEEKKLFTSRRIN